MSATEVLHGHSYGSIVSVGVSLLIVEGGGNVDTAGRTDDELAPVLRIEIQQNVALQLAFRQFVGPIHAGLLVAGDECLDGTVLQVLVLHDSHNGSDAQTIVGTECRASGFHPFAVNPWPYGVGLEVVGRLGCLLRHHVHMSLEDDALLLLHTRCSRLAEHDVAGRVFESLDAGLFAEVEQELLYFL